MKPVYADEGLEVYLRQVGERFDLALVELPREVHAPVKLRLTKDNYFRLLCGRGCEAGFARMQVINGTMCIAIEESDPFDPTGDDPVWRIPWEPIERAIRTMMHADR